MMDNNRRYIKDDEEDILAFGYSCKIFRDDEKAENIDKGVHLIPCMADPTLMIDRFDVRGVLTDLEEAESKGFEKVSMTEVQIVEEKAVEYESFCDYPVYNNYNDEERMYQDEEQRRLKMELTSDMYTYNQVNLSYNNESNYCENPTEEERFDTSIQIADDEIFVPTLDLNIPQGMEIPTVKQHKIIVKTARFVANHGPQMEIVLMTKQASNQSFNFMSFDNKLNPYYKHIIHQIKIGKLKFPKENEDSSKDSHKNDFHFNISQVTPDLTPGTMNPTKPSSTVCTYSNLINKIREKQKASGVEESDIYSPSMPSSPNTCVTVPEVKENVPPLPPSISILPVVGLVDYPTVNQAADNTSDEDDYNHKTDSIGIDKFKVYDYNKMKWPSPEMQMVIDKLACYIVKNGPAFRELVKNRKDPRFDFLNSGHEYNSYYQCKLQLYNEVYGDTFNYPQKGLKNASTPVKGIQRTKYSSKGRAISFSIKSKDVEAPLSSHTTFPVESSTSDEEMEEEEREYRRSVREQKKREMKQKEEKARKEKEAQLLKENEDNSDNDDLYDIFKYAQNIGHNKVVIKNKDSKKKTQSKQMERKMKAAAFLGKLKTENTSTNGGPPVFGPHLPFVIKSNVDSVRQMEELVSSNSSTPSGSNTERLNSMNSLSPVASMSEDSTRNWLLKETVKSPNPENNQLNLSLSPFIGDVQEENTEYSGPISPKTNWSHSKKSSLKRSRSRSPGRHREKKKKKKSHSSQKRKRHRSRSRSKERSKSHRSSHKKRKHSSHKEKSKSKKKKHRRYSSPSLSSLSSESSKSSSNFPSDSDSEVQVILPKKKKKNASSSRSSSVISIPEEKFARATQSGEESSSEANCEKTNIAANVDTISKTPVPFSLTLGEETSSSFSDLQENEKKSSFQLSKSSAVAKITEGLRAKLHAMLEKRSSV